MNIQDLFEKGDLIAIQELNDVKKQSGKLSIRQAGIGYGGYKSSAPFGLFYCPNPMKKTGSRNIDNVRLLNALFCDIDDGDYASIKAFSIQPHYVFSRNDSHYHIIWLIDRQESNEETRNKYREIMNKIIPSLGGDPAVKSPAGLLRVPGSEQHKPGEGGRYELLEHNDLPRYKLDDLHSKLCKKKEQSREKRKEKILTEITDEQIFSFLREHYKKTGKRHKGDGRSRFLFFVGLDCHKWGIDQTAALEFAEKINDKLCEPPEKESVLHHQIKSAYLYARDEFGAVREAAEKGDANEEIDRYKNEIRIREKLKSWVFVASIDRFMNLTDGMELTTITQIDNYIAYVCATDMKFRTMLKKQLIRVVEKIDFRPDIQKRIFKDSTGARTLNRFSRLKIYENNNGEKAKEAIKVFEEHLRYLSTTDKEYTALKNYLAYIVQNPGKKLPYAVLIISRFHGIGKSMLETLFRNIFHSITGVNYVGALENEQLSSSYTHFLADKILCFVHELSQGDKYHIMNRFKNLITESVVEINAKYAKPYTIRNTNNFMLFSNNQGAIKIDKNDRRLFVVYNDKQPMEQEYYSELYRTFTENYIDIFNHLSDVDLTDFNPYSRPEMTAGKQQLIEQSESELALYLDDLRENAEIPFDKELIILNDLQEMIETSAPNMVRGKASVKALKMYLINNDYVSTKEFIRIGKKAVNRTFWHHNSVRPTKEQLKDFLESQNDSELDEE